MLNLRVRLVNDNGTINSATSRVLPTHNIVYTTAVNEQGTLTFQVSRDDFVPTQFPFVVRVEQSVNGGSFAPTTQNSLFIVERDSDDSKDVGKIVTYEAVGFVPWLVQGALLSWASSAKDGKRTWYEPSKKPASAGYTFHGMLTEAKNGGWFPMLTWDFNGTRDSGGNNWVAADKAVTAWEMSLNLATILEQMTEDGRCEWTTSGTTLRMFRIGMMGADKPDVIIGGRGFSSVPVRTDATGLYSHIRAVPDKLPWQNYTSDTSLRSRFGHRSILLTQSGISSKSESAKNAAGYIAAGKEVVREESYDWTPDVNLPHPWVDFDLGDQVTAHSRGGKQLRRIVALIVNQDGFEPAQVNVRVGKLIKSRAAKIKDRLNSVAVGGIVGGSGAGFPLNSGPQNNRPAAPAGVLVKSQTGVWLPDGTARSEVEIEWSEVTMAEDGSEIDVVEYEVWSRTPSGTLQRDVATQDLSVVVDTWAINQARVVAVRAKSALGEWSEFSDDLMITVEEPDSIVPKVPTNLRVGTNVGMWSVQGAMAQVVVQWDEVTESTDDTPITIESYEYLDPFNGISQALFDSGLGNYAVLYVPSGQSHGINVRAVSSAGVRGDFTPQLTFTAATPDITTLTPVAPVLTSGFGNVFARWTGNYTTTPNASQALSTANVRVEAKIQGDSTWIPQGTLGSAGEQIITVGNIGDTVQVRFIAYDKLDRATGTSAVEEIEVVGIEPPDISGDLQDWIIANGGSHVTASQTEPSPHSEGDLWFVLDEDNEVTGIQISDGTIFKPYVLVADSIIVPGSITGQTLNVAEIWTSEAWLNVLNTGIIKADYVEPNFGETLNISANESVTFIVGRQDEQDTAIADAQETASNAADAAAEAATDAANASAQAAIADGKALVAQAAAEDANTRITEQQAVFRVISTGAEVASKDNTNAVRITPDGVSIIQGNATASTWSAGRLIVNEAVLVRARIGNHVVERSGAGRTIFRPI